MTGATLECADAVRTWLPPPGLDRGACRGPILEPAESDRIQEETAERVGIPVLEPGATPATIDREQPIDLGAADGKDGLCGRFEVEPIPEAHRPQRDLQQSTLPSEALGLAALPQCGHLRFGGSSATHHLIEGRPSLKDRPSVSTQDLEPATGIRFLAHLLHPCLIEDLRRPLAAGDRDVHELGEDGAFRSEGREYRLGGDRRARGDRVDRRRDIAAFAEEGAAGIEDRLPSRPCLLATTRRVVNATTLDRLLHTATVTL